MNQDKSIDEINSNNVPLIFVLFLYYCVCPINVYYWNECVWVCDGCKRTMVLTICVIVVENRDEHGWTNTIDNKKHSFAFVISLVKFKFRIATTTECIIWLKTTSTLAQHFFVGNNFFVFLVENKSVLNFHCEEDIEQLTIHKLWIITLLFFRNNLF